MEGWLETTDFLLVDLPTEKHCLHRTDSVCVPPTTVLRLWMQDSFFDLTLQKMTYMYMYMYIIYIHDFSLVILS